MLWDLRSRVLESIIERRNNSLGFGVSDLDLGFRVWGLLTDGSGFGI